MKVKAKLFAEWCGVKKAIEGDVTGVCIDTRQIKRGDAFFAFKGEHVDGEEFVFDAIENGASVVIVTKSCTKKHDRIIKVANVERALQYSAKAYRQTLSVKIVGITGSVGKTSTKEMIKQVLSSKYKTIATRGNLNNEIGLPLMIFDIEANHEWAVLEMGMNHYNEIHRLVDIARPTIAVITNIGTAHIEFLGSRSNIAKAKFEIVDYLTKHDHLVLNRDDVMLRRYGDFDCNTHVVGGKFDDIHYGNAIVTEHATTFKLFDGEKAYEVEIPLIGQHHIYNAMLAIKVGQIADIRTEQAVAALINTERLKMRFDIQKIGDITVINDAYNASQFSINASCKTFMAMPYKKRIVVLGDILETGIHARDVHTSIGNLLFNYKFDLVIFIGVAMQYAYETYQGEKLHFSSINGVAEVIYTSLKHQGDAVLFKASRGMQLEKIIEELRRVMND